MSNDNHSLYEEMRKLTDGGSESMTHKDALAQLELWAKSSEVVQPDPVMGDLLPPIGSDVLIRHGRDDDDHLCTVTGYYVWGDLDGNRSLQRVFVRVVYKGTDTKNSRMLCDLRRTDGTPFVKANEAQTTSDIAPDCWVVVKDGSIIGTHDKPAHFEGVQAVRYVPAAPVAPMAAHRVLLHEFEQRIVTTEELENLQATYPYSITVLEAYPSVPFGLCVQKRDRPNAEWQARPTFATLKSFPEYVDPRAQPYTKVTLVYAAPVGRPAALVAQAEPTPALAWLYSHCKAIGMTCQSDSGKLEHDIALFTLNQKDTIDATIAKDAT